MLVKLESGLLYLMRIIMVLLVLFTLFTFVMWGIGSLSISKASDTPITPARDWSALKIDDKELQRITYSDYGYDNIQQTQDDEKLAADSAVVTAFAEVDTLLRAAIEANPAARKKLETDNGELGLAPAQPLPALVKALHAKERALYNTTSATAAAVDATAAAIAAAAAASTEEDLIQPTNIGEALLQQTRSIISSYQYDAGRAFALGAPAALKTLLADPKIQAGISQQTASSAVSNLLMNYNMAFSTKAAETDTTEAPRHGWLERLLEPGNLMIFTVLLWSFVLMMMIVVFLRVERHMRAMAAESKVLAQRQP